MPFPATRFRRLRSTPALRSLVRETHLSPHQLIYPLFICEGEGIRREIPSMPGVFNLSVDEALKEAEQAAALGLGGLLLFGLPDPTTKDDQGSGAYDPQGITQRALRALKATAASKHLVLVADVCLCEYTSHGHCGLVTPTAHQTGSHQALQGPQTLQAPQARTPHRNTSPAKLIHPPSPSPTTAPSNFSPAPPSPSPPPALTSSRPPT